MPKEARTRNLPIFTEEEVQERLHILLAGVAQYNDGYYFEAHETWEDLWHPSPPPARQFLQGLIQLAAAFVHFARHEYPGTVRLLAEAIEKMQTAPAVYLGIDVARLLAESRGALEEIERLGPQRFETRDRERIPAIHLVQP